MRKENTKRIEEVAPVLIKADYGFAQWLNQVTGKDIPVVSTFQEIPADANVLFVPVNSDPTDRTKRTGFSELQRLRAAGCPLPVLFLSFESREMLQDFFPFLKESEAAVEFLQLPCAPKDVFQKAKKLIPLTNAQLSDFKRLDKEIRKERSRLIHDLTSRLRNGGSLVEPEMRNLFQRLRESVYSYAPEQTSEFSALEFKFETSRSADSILDALETLENALNKTKKNKSLPSGEIPASAPQQFNRIGIVDDQDNFIAPLLKLHGYEIVFDVRTAEEAMELISKDGCPEIILSDLNIPDQAAGLEVMRRALSKNPSACVICTSRARDELVRLPRKVKDIRGPQSSQDLKTIHSTIWQHAYSLGFTKSNPTINYSEDLKRMSELQFRLEGLALNLHRNQLHWQQLPEEIKEFALKLHEKLTGNMSSDQRDMLNTMLGMAEKYHRWSEKRELTLIRIKDLMDDTERLEKLIKNFPGDISFITEMIDLMHNTIKQNPPGVVAGIGVLPEGLFEITKELENLDDKIQPARVKELKAAIRQWETEQSLESLSQLKDAIRSIQKRLPRGKITRAIEPENWKPKNENAIIPEQIVVAVIEDNEAHQAVIKQLIEEINDNLDVELIYRPFSNKKDALDFISDVGNGSARCGIIAVVDMGIPADREEAELGKVTPKRQNGYEVLERLRSYNLNVSCIVFTSPSNMYEDLQKVGRQGIFPTRYISKNTDSLPNDLKRQIKSIIENDFGWAIKRSNVSEIDFFWKSPVTEVYIDGILIELTPTPLNVFYALCRLSERSKDYHSIESIFEYMEANLDVVVRNPERIRDEIETIRKSIHNYFNLHGGTVNLDDIIETCGIL